MHMWHLEPNVACPNLSWASFSAAVRTSSRSPGRFSFFPVLRFLIFRRPILQLTFQYQCLSQLARLPRGTDETVLGCRECLLVTSASSHRLTVYSDQKKHLLSSLTTTARNCILIEPKQRLTVFTQKARQSSPPAPLGVIGVRSSSGLLHWSQAFRDTTCACAPVSNNHVSKRPMPAFPSVRKFVNGSSLIVAITMTAIHNQSTKPFTLQFPSPSSSFTSGADELRHTAHR